MKCLCCGSTDLRFLETDHVVPKARGGQDEPSNYQTLCRTCNRRKGSKTIDYRVSPPLVIEARNINATDDEPLQKLTLTIPEDVVKEAKHKALDANTSISKVVTAYLRVYAKEGVDLPSGASPTDATKE